MNLEQNRDYLRQLLSIGPKEEDGRPRLGDCVNRVHIHTTGPDHVLTLKESICYQKSISAIFYLARDLIDFKEAPVITLRPEGVVYQHQLVSATPRAIVSSFPTHLPDEQISTRITRPISIHLNS
jgi:hypothetical protein